MEQIITNLVQFKMSNIIYLLYINEIMILYLLKQFSKGD